MIDHLLLCCLICYISKLPELDGSILVFLPRFRDIAIQKEMLEKLEMQNFDLFILHSAMNNRKSKPTVRIIHVCFHFGCFILCHYNR